MSLGDISLLVGGKRKAILRNLAWAGAQPHRRSLVRNVPLFFHYVDDRMGRILIELSAVGFLEVGNVTGKFDNGDLHTEAESKIRNLVFACVLYGRNLAFGASIPKTARYEQPIEIS